MSRQREVNQVEVARTEYHVTEKVMCDKCGRDISPDTPNEEYRNTLEVYLNPDYCVNSRFRRDYCSDCANQIWSKICELIGAYPDDISGSDFDET